MRSGTHHCSQVRVFLLRTPVTSELRTPWYVSLKLEIQHIVYWQEGVETLSNLVDYRVLSLESRETT